MTSKSKTILIVDDDQAFCETMREAFLVKGFEVITATDGQKGLKASLDKHPDLIMLDIMMPVMDGMTMLSLLRKDEWGKDAKIIMLTNLSDSKLMAGAMSHGSFDYIIKSDWKLEDIINKAQKRLEE